MPTHRLLLALLALLGAGCGTVYPTHTPGPGVLTELEQSYWNEGRTDLPPALAGVWAPLDPADPDDRDWFVFTRRQTYRRLRSGIEILEEGGVRMRQDVLFLHVQRLKGRRFLAPNFFRFRYELNGDALRLRFLAASSRGDAIDDAYRPAVHRLVRVGSLPKAADPAHADLGPIELVPR